jgi:hypothetical protein
VVRAALRKIHAPEGLETHHGGTTQPMEAPIQRRNKDLEEMEVTQPIEVHGGSAQPMEAPIQQRNEDLEGMEAMGREVQIVMREGKV